MTQAMMEYIEKAEHPTVEYWFGKLNMALKKNIVAFQAAFGMLSFGSMTGFVYSIATKRPEAADFLWLAMWSVVFTVFIITIQLEHWKEREDLTRKQREIDIGAKDRFNTKFIEWLYNRADKLDNEKALELFQQGMIIFGTVPTDTVATQLTQMMMLMNDIVFNTKKSMVMTKKPTVSSRPPDTSHALSLDKLTVKINKKNEAQVSDTTIKASSE